MNFSKCDLYCFDTCVSWSRLREPALDRWPWRRWWPAGHLRRWWGQARRCSLRRTCSRSSPTSAAAGSASYPCVGIFIEITVNNSVFGLLWEGRENCIVFYVVVYSVAYLSPPSPPPSRQAFPQCVNPTGGGGGGCMEIYSICLKNSRIYWERLGKQILTHPLKTGLPSKVVRDAGSA